MQILRNWYDDFIDDIPREAVTYKKTMATYESAIKLRDGGVLEGFPVDAGMICLCDVQTAEEYRAFLDKWYAQNPAIFEC